LKIQPQTNELSFVPYRQIMADITRGGATVRVVLFGITATHRDPQVISC